MVSSGPNPLPAGTSYTIRWTPAPVSFATTFDLQEKIGAGEWTTHTTSLLTFGFPAQPVGTYQYRVRACRSTVCTAYSGIYTLTIAVGIPQQPAWVRVSPTSSTDGTYTLTWSATAGATSYQLEENYNGHGWEVLTPRVTGSLQQWSPSPPKALSGMYTYHVSACNDAGCSSPQVNEEPVTVTRTTTVTVPTGLQACKTNGPPAQRGCAAAGSAPLLFVANGTYQVSWTPVQNATSYNYRLKRTSQCGTTTETQMVNVESVNGSAANANCGSSTYAQEFEYAVQACAGANCSAWTAPTVTVRADTSTPRRAASLVPTYIHTDGLRSPVAETDASGAVIGSSRNRYEPYGKTLMPAKQGPGYAGHVTDEKTGLSYMQQRYYDPIAGRFLSTDPVAANPASFNRYWYANNNPYGNIDPDGRNPVLAAIVITAGIEWLLRPSIANAPAPGDATFSNVMSGVEVAQEVARVVPASKLGSMIKLGAKAGDKLSQNAAAREAKRQAGIPTSQQPSSQTNGRASDGTPVGRQQSYEVPAAGGGTESKSVQVSRDTRGDHAGMSQIEAGTVKPGGQTDVGGRPRIQNVDKVRVDFDPKR